MYMRHFSEKKSYQETYKHIKYVRGGNISRSKTSRSNKPLKTVYVAYEYKIITRTNISMNLYHRAIYLNQIYINKILNILKMVYNKNYTVQYCALCN